MFLGWVTMAASCASCGRTYGFGEGEWSGAVIIAQLLAGLAAIPVFVALTVLSSLSLGVRALVTVVFVTLLMMATYRNVKGMWFGFLHGADDVQRAKQPRKTPP